MNLKPYPEYKDSGVAWLGKVPKHWEMRKTKYLSEINPSIKTIENERTRVSFVPMERTRENYPFFNPKNRAYKEVRTGFTCFQDNDILIAKITPCFENGKGGICLNLVNGIGFGSTEFHVIRTKSLLEKAFFYYVTISKSFRNYGAENMQGSAGQKRVPTDFIKNLVLAFPSTSEQLLIARFLDYKTAQITRFIKAKKRMIELLKEQKQVIINDAVTGKIVIKDEGGRLKAEKRPDSSFIPHPSSFLQTVPEGWEVKRIKSISHIRYGLGQPPKEKEDGLPLIRATNVDHGKIVVKDLLRIDINDVPASRNAVLREGEIIVVRSGAYTADSAIIPKEFTGSVAGYDMVMTVFKAMPEYVALALLSKYLRDDQLIQASMRAAQPHLNKEELGSSFIILPQNEEQETIVLVTEKKLNALDQAISRTEREIALIQEYRTRLISDVVTGKIDVRDIEIPDIANIDDTIDESIEEPEGEEELETAEAEA